MSSQTRLKDTSSIGEPESRMLADADRLESLGYKQELKRNISNFETFSFAFSIMGVVPSIASTIFYSLPYGGPVTMAWGWLLAGGLITFIGLGLSDLASSMPTSGGLYYWTHRLGPDKYKNLLAWFVGYNSFLGNTAATASLAWACAGQMFAAASVANNEFTYTTGQQFGLYVGVLAAVGLLCAYGCPILIRLQGPTTFLNLALAAVTIIGLPIARRKELNTAAYTFGGFENLTGWSPGFAFILGLLAPVWTICSFDCAVSISEEASNAATAVPFAITGSISIATILGTVIMLILALTMGPDLSAVNDSDIGQPLAYIYNQAFGRNGTLAIWSFMCIATFMMTSSLAMPASRQAFAFARDGGLPFSKFWYHVNPRTVTPVRTVWLLIALCVPLGALGFADEAAINAIFALAIIGPYFAYGIPLATRVFTTKEFVPGPWYLGRFSRPVAAIAVVWMIFACIIFCFPADTGADASTMNYACVVAAGVWAFSLGYWFMPKIGGKTFFTGPAVFQDHNSIETDMSQEYAGIAVPASTEYDKKTGTPQ